MCVAVGEVVRSRGYRGGREAQVREWDQRYGRRSKSGGWGRRSRTIGEAVAWWRRKLGVEVSYKRLCDWFRRWGYRKRVPRPMTERADHQAQQAWKKGAMGSLTGGGAKASGTGPCGFLQGEGGGRGGAALFS
jgi:transposase